MKLILAIIAHQIVIRAQAIVLYLSDNDRMQMRDDLDIRIWQAIERADIALSEYKLSK